MSLILLEAIENAIMKQFLMNSEKLLQVQYN